MIFVNHLFDGKILVIADDGGRYAYDQQPDICKWNLQKLTEALAPLISKEEALPILATYNGHFENFYIEKMRKKVLYFLSHTNDDFELYDSTNKLFRFFAKSFVDVVVCSPILSPS